MPAPIGHLPYPGCETGGRPKKWTTEVIEEEATVLIEWAKKDSSLVVGKHYGERGYTYAEANRWSKQNDFFAYAKDLAMTIVGSRREEMALLGTIEHNIVKTSLGVYDPNYKQYQLDLKASDEKRREEQSFSMLDKICKAIEIKKNPIKKNDGDL
jgi:hypothetical protein